MKQLCFIISLLLLIFIAATAHASNGECKNVPLTDLTYLQMLAEKGNVAAQRQLGHFYADPQGVNRKEKDNWPGSLNADGAGATKNYVEAIKWWRKAAEQGNADALFQIGNAYIFGESLSGTSVKQDFVEGIKWYRMAAEHGDPFVALRLADLYAKEAMIAFEAVFARQSTLYR